MLFMLALTLYLPTRILFVEVDGNRIVETNRILEAAAQCGLGFGSNRRAIRSEQIKNQLLQQLEDLQWAGVNTYGCRAVISVKERKKEQNAQSNETVTSIVAGRDGIIEHLTVHSGNRLCTPGQAVREGQVLISGYTDCGICIRAGRAEGEVFARTTRHLSCKYPVDFNMKGEITGSEKKISLLIGKKQINFFQDSGISTLGCDKMYLVKYMTLPGGFRLPLALVVQTQTNYELSSGTVNEEVAQQWLSCFARQYLTGQMIAGEIRGKTEQLERSNESLVLQGTYECLEMIGQTRFEEYHFDYGEID
jgi:sporulation protein YqfD